MAREYKLPEVLTSLLKQNKLSANKLAYKLDIGQKSVYEWQHFKGMPSVYSLMMLSDFFGVTIDYLVYGDEQ